RVLPRGGPDHQVVMEADDRISVRLELLLEPLGLLPRPGTHPNLPGRMSVLELFLLPRLSGRLVVPALFVLEPVLDDAGDRAEPEIPQHRLDHGAGPLGLGAS